MFEEITNPIFGAFDSAVCFVSDVMADTTGFRCTRTGTGILPFGAPPRRQTVRRPVQRRMPTQPTQIRRTAPRNVPTPPPAQRRVQPARAGFKMITRG